MSLFIQIELSADAVTVAALAAICPVNIFAWYDGRIIVRDERQDECTLCELCLQAAPAGSVKIHKLYSGEILCTSISTT
jgi:ferredoxin-like protein FixX